MNRPFYKHQRLMMNQAAPMLNPALLVDMRLGKTAVTIRTLLLRSVKKVLVIAPLGVVGVWKRELQKEGITDVVALIGPKAKRLKMLEEKASWWLINYRGFMSIGKDIRKKFDAVVLDEAIKIKTPGANITQLLLKCFRGVKYKVILSGLLNPESDLELWCPFAFLNGTAFGCKSYWSFRNKYFEQTYYDWEPKPGTKTFIAKYLRQHAVLMTRKDADADCKKAFNVRYAYMEDACKKVYDKVLTGFSLPGRETANALTRRHWLLQLANGWCDGVFYGDHKVAELMQILKEEIPRQPVVIWFVYNEDIDNIGMVLDLEEIPYRFINGHVPPFERDAIRADFDAGVFDILLMQVAIGQYGLNLSKAETAIFYSCPDSLDKRLQAEDRIVDAGRGAPVNYIDLLTYGTIEEDLYNMVVEKRVKSPAVINLALNQRIKL